MNGLLANDGVCNVQTPDKLAVLAERTTITSSISLMSSDARIERQTNKNQSSIIHKVVQRTHRAQIKLNSTYRMPVRSSRSRDASSANSTDTQTIKSRSERRIDGVSNSDSIEQHASDARKNAIDKRRTPIEYRTPV